MAIAVLYLRNSTSPFCLNMHMDNILNKILESFYDYTSKSSLYMFMCSKCPGIVYLEEVELVQVKQYQ